MTTIRQIITTGILLALLAGAALAGNPSPTPVDTCDLNNPPTNCDEECIFFTDAPKIDNQKGCCNGFCSTSSCVTNFGDQNNAQANCATTVCTDCLECNYINSECSPTTSGNHCYGYVIVKNGCDPDSEYYGDGGKMCFSDGASDNFKVCNSFYPRPTASPTLKPTVVPTSSPSLVPTSSPSLVPTSSPSLVPTSSPSLVPTSSPSLVPTSSPSLVPTSSPSLVPTSSPSLVPTSSPSLVPTSSPSLVPTNAPVLGPGETYYPTSRPTNFTADSNPDKKKKRKRRPLLRRNDKNETTLFGLPQAASISLLTLLAFIIVVSSGAAYKYGATLNRFMKISNSETESLAKDFVATNEIVMEAPEEENAPKNKGEKRPLVQHHSRQSSSSRF